MTDLDWWRGAAIYQVYPRSFQDSNGDGVGDLPGITRRLDHIASLGIDAVWISPFFRSPMADMGYDVSDYCDVDPMFGTLADFDALLARAHDLELKVIIDQVLNHTSDQHIWFKESRTDRTNAKADWYVWADPRQDGTGPNNWLSIFGGTAWEWDGKRRQYYMHSFLASQPDLNFHNPQVQDAILDAARFWLDRGVDGFRLDACNHYFHDVELRDNPPLIAEGPTDLIPPNPYLFQNNIRNISQPENLDFMARVRALLGEYPGTVAVGEVAEIMRGPEIIEQYTSGNQRLNFCYTFDLFGADFSGDFFRAAVTKYEAAMREGWVCWTLSNHDITRHDQPLRQAARGPRWHRAPLPAHPRLAPRRDLPLSGRGAWVCRRPSCGSRICAIPMASASGPPAKAATVAVRRWRGKATDAERWFYRRQALASLFRGASFPCRRCAGKGSGVAASPLPRRHSVSEKALHPR
jgi:alpha-glucosidase